MQINSHFPRISPTNPHQLSSLVAFVPDEEVVGSNPATPPPRLRIAEACHAEATAREILAVKHAAKARSVAHDRVMEESPRAITRGWLITLIGIAILAGGLIGLCFPVFLNSYDSVGIQVKCGNGYYAELTQATADDERSTSRVAQPATGYASQCMNALAHRREWLIPVAALGGIILISELVAWSRVKSRNSAADTNDWSEEPLDALHEAHVLDRRYHSRWQPPSDTTL